MTCESWVLTLVADDLEDVHNDDEVRGGELWNTKRVPLYPVTVDL